MGKGKKVLVRLKSSSSDAFFFENLLLGNLQNANWEVALPVNLLEIPIDMAAILGTVKRIWMFWQHVFETQGLLHEQGRKICIIS